VLWWRILTSFSKKIIGKFGQHFKCPAQPLAWFPKNDFVAAAENLKYFAFDGEFFRQSDCLAIS